MKEKSSFAFNVIFFNQIVEVRNVKKLYVGAIGEKVSKTIALSRVVHYLCKKQAIEKEDNKYKVILRK